MFQDVSIELPDFEQSQIVDEIFVQESGKYFFVDCEVAWQLQLLSFSREVAVIEWKSELDMLCINVYALSFFF